MSKTQEDWLEELVSKYSIPANDKEITDKRGMLSENQLKNLSNGKS
tara:strand:- start:89 stop:226 length:138 start_codon:yes stop_codon:yes gene_type:complete